MLIKIEEVEVYNLLVKDREAFVSDMKLVIAPILKLIYKLISLHFMFFHIKEVYKQMIGKEMKRLIHLGILGTGHVSLVHHL